MSLSDLEREQNRQANERMIEMLCRLGMELVKPIKPVEEIRKQVASAGDYKYAESLYLHGDLSGR